MKFKVLPEPVASPSAVDVSSSGHDDEADGEADVDAVVERIAEMQRAVPLVPDEETSCCARLMERAGVPSQDRSKEWLTFLRALRLVGVENGRYRRLERDADPDDLREAFLERIFLAEEVLEVLDAADEPLCAESVFEQLGDRLPQWERYRHTDPESIWVERVARILEWAVAFGLVARASEDRYATQTTADGDDASN